MAQLPLATFTSPGVPLYQPYGTSANLSSLTGDLFTWTGATDPQSEFAMDMTLSTATNFAMSVDNDAGGQATAVLQLISSGDFTATVPGGFYVDSLFLSTGEVVCSTISTVQIDIDGQTLTANPTELLLNGVPVATQSSLSSIADWALDPAISSVNMSGFDLFSTNRGFFSTLSSSAVFANSGVFNDISTVTFTALSSVTVVSTISSLVLEGNLIQTSTLFANAFLSTPDIEVSSINGAQFGNSSITVEVVGVSSLVANSISSVGAEIRAALVSTIQFSPSANFSPNLDVNLGLGNLFGNLGGAALGGIGVVVGGAALGTGIAALTQTRQTSNINPSSFELVAGVTQLQISTLGTQFSTVYRFVSSVSENVPGQEYFVSTIHSPGVAIRSLSDPLNTISAPTSTLQSFGQWVALDANLPIPSTVSTFQQLFTSSIAVSTLTAQGQIFIEPSTTRSGVWLPFDATNGTGTLAIGLSTSASIFETYAFWAAGIGWPYNGTQSTMMTLLETRDNEASYQFADLNVGRILLQGPNIYGVNAVPYLSGDPGGTLTAVAGAFLTSNVVCSTLRLSPSTIAYSQPNDSEMVVASDTDPQDLSQIAVSAVRLASTVSGANGILSYGQLTDRALFLNSSIQTNTLAFTVDSNLSVSSFTVSSINGLAYPFLPSTVSTFSSLTASSIAANTESLSTLTFNGISTITFSTVAAAGGQGQPAGRLAMSGCDLDIGQNDLWCQQVRIGAGNPGGSAQTEVLFYSPDASTIRGFNIGGQDRTIRVVSTVNSGTGGYVLDTNINPPFFSTIGGNVNLMAFFPSTNVSTLGVSTISVIPATAATNTSSIFTSSIQSIGGVSSLSLAANPSASLNFPPNGDIDFIGKEIFIQSQGAGNTTLYANADLNGGTWSNGTPGRGFLNASSISVSTNQFSVNGVAWPSLVYFASAYNSVTQAVAGANVSTLANLNTTALNVGGFTVSTSNITVPVAGTYELNASFQFATTSGGTNLAQFWLIKNGAAVPQTNSRVTVANNADNLGTISIFDTAAANDSYGWMFYSADANMSATAVAAGATPAIPSLIFNIKRLG